MVALPKERAFSYVKRLYPVDASEVPSSRSTELGTYAEVEGVKLRWRGNFTSHCERAFREWQSQHLNVESS